MPRADYSRKTDYTAEDVERGLFALAFANGNATAAEKALEDQGHRIPKSTLQVWQRREAERYSEIRDELVPRIHANLAQEFEDLSREAVDATAETLRLYRKCLEPDDNGKPDLKSANALSTMARNTSTVSGISADKVQPLRLISPPTSGDRTGEALLRELTRLAPGLIVNATAEDITDADVVTELPSGINGNGNGDHEPPSAA